VKAGGERLEGRTFEDGYSSRKVIKVEGGEETEIFERIRGGRNRNRGKCQE
jgi:hypothetical protein